MRLPEVSVRRPQQEEEKENEKSTLKISREEMIADSAVCVQDYGVARHPIPVAIPKVGAPTVHPPKQEVARHNIPLIEQETPAAETVQETLEDLIAYCKNVVTVTTAGAARSLLRSVRMRLEGASSEALYSNDIENGLLDQFSQRLSDP